MVVLHAIIKEWDLTGARVLLRADLNCQEIDPSIIPLRLLGLIPTIKLLQSKGAKIILATHIGRPHGYQKEYSTQTLIKPIEQAGFTVAVERSLQTAYKKSFHDFNTILLLENLRFFPGEKRKDPQFAQELAQLGDFYVNDAFGSLAGNESSLALTAYLFEPEKRSIGLLIEHELQKLNGIIHNHKKWLLILGGNKIADKIPDLEPLLPHLEALCLGPAVVFTLMAAQGLCVGKSLVDKNPFDAALKLNDDAKKQGVELFIPQDFLCTLPGSDQLRIYQADEIPCTAYGITIGPETQRRWAQRIANAQCTIYNGLMGDIHDQKTLTGVASLFKAMSISHSALIAGGDSTYAAQMLYDKSPIFLSTGGSTTLSYLGGSALPGLAPFNISGKN